MVPGRAKRSCKRLAAFAAVVLLFICLADVAYVALRKHKPATIIRQSEEDAQFPEDEPVVPIDTSEETPNSSRLSLRRRKRSDLQSLNIRMKRKSGRSARIRNLRRRRLVSSRRTRGYVEQYTVTTYRNGVAPRLIGLERTSSKVDIFASPGVVGAARAIIG